EEVTKERDAQLEKVKGLESRVQELESRLKELGEKMVEAAVYEEEKAADPAGVYAEFSRARLVKTILELNDSMLEATNSQFLNAVEQLQILNAGKELNLEGLDEEKVVRDGQLVTPPEED
ncbi:hypothetical protein A2U01_0045023, partial [Trifolium medium]|nr:hypothetical protein [Trifolium medium]